MQETVHLLVATTELEEVRPREKAVMIVEDSFSCFHGESSVVALLVEKGKETCGGRDLGVLKTE